MLLSEVAQERQREAVRAAAAARQLARRQRNDRHLDLVGRELAGGKLLEQAARRHNAEAGLAERDLGVLVPVVGQRDARPQRHEVDAVGPLLPLLERRDAVAIGKENIKIKLKKI